MAKKQNPLKNNKRQHQEKNRKYEQSERNYIRRHQEKNEKMLIVRKKLDTSRPREK